MNSFMYDPNDNASSGSYTFKETDTVKQKFPIRIVEEMPDYSITIWKAII